MVTKGIFIRGTYQVGHLSGIVNKGTVIRGDTYIITRETSDVVTKGELSDVVTMGTIIRDSYQGNIYQG